MVRRDREVSKDYDCTSREYSTHSEIDSPHHVTKRRKLNHDCHDDSSSGEELRSSSSTIGVDGNETSGNHDKDEDESSKPKSKYRIHVPKHSGFPQDAFFTQPPQRSSSPYRIDQFHWQKPKKQSSGCHRSNIESLSSRKSNTTIIERPPEALANDKESNGLPSPVDALEDEFSIQGTYGDLLANLPSDAFSSPSTQVQRGPEDQLWQPKPALAAPLANLRQTTLFGTQAAEVSTQTQTNRKHNWPLANRDEPATHHNLDEDALKTWVYPTNLGTIRDYQYSIVAKGLYHNMLVALPTGLGKTFIAATIMLNWYRWTTKAQIVFVAPTKPLVSQQVKACFDIVGIPRSATTMLTGGVAPGLRAEEWQSKRVFFMTPQTIVNDLKTGICDPKRLVLLVVDEAHRATGGYAYVEVVKFLRRFNTSFRVLALTATPGASVESVQEVIDGLGISRIEIRTEESIDIRQYVHPRKIETILFDNSDEMIMVMDLFSRALQPVLQRLNGMNAYWMKDPMMLTPFGCNQARVSWMSSEAGRKADFGLKGMVNTIFSLLASLSHGIELLKYHGIGPFYHKVLAFRNEIHANGKKGGKYAKQINESEHFQTMMSRVQIWINHPDFIGHPKLEYLQSAVMNHFLDAGEGRGASDPSSTKVMIFAHYRDSAEEIARVLRRNDPMVRPHIFVGQATSKGSEGMDQKKQLDIIQKFKNGIYNTLVATSIGEEGLDIGEVDLIICYDASASPIRMLQRMGRTGRKRAGNIVVTLMKGKEENNFIKAKDNYEKMQQEIAIGSRFNFHDEESRRIVPKNIQPTVDKKVIDIPLENTQSELPEPTRRGRAPKKPPKKFHMPDGVRTGFVQASRLSDDGLDLHERAIQSKPRSRAIKVASPEPIPSLDEVLLTASEEKKFERTYLNIEGDDPQIVEAPRNDTFPSLQRSLRPTKYLEHGHKTKRFVGMLANMHNITPDVLASYERHLDPQDRKAGMAQASRRTQFFDQHSSLIGLRERSGGTPRVCQSLPRLPPCSSPRNRQGKVQTLMGISSDEDNEVGNISDLINDDLEDGLVDVFSSTPPPSAEAVESQYSAMTEIPNNEPDFEDELPGFGTLVQLATATKFSKVRRLPDRKENAKSGLRKGRRNVIGDDSDDE